MYFSLRCMLFCLCPGEILVVGSNRPTVAAPGDTVVLPCHLEPTFDVRGLTVEWSRLDLKPDPSDQLSRVEYVHLYRDRNEDRLFADAMEHGNISLKLTNVSEGDAGRYRCFVPKLQSRVKFAIVELVVSESKCFLLLLLLKAQLRLHGRRSDVHGHFTDCSRELLQAYAIRAIGLLGPLWRWHCVHHGQ
uniref:Ig-like domain-containing protein n=1 Tax=Haplochromis burtoni TaxID=8153 RepID=A0A3Q2X9B3_HAPBU